MADRQTHRIELEVTGVAHGGVFVARHEGRVVFVSDAIPGERVVAEVTDASKNSFWRAETVDVLTASEHRRPHIWSASALERPPAARAGGAEFGHIALAHQRELKRQVVTDSLRRMGGVEVDVEVEGLANGSSPESAGVDQAGTGWRTRVRLHVDEAGVPGQYAARSHSVVAVDDLPLAVAELQALDVPSQRFPGIEFVDAVSPSDGEPFILPGPPRERRSPVRKGRRRGGAPRNPPRTDAVIGERVGTRRFELAADGFWQVHRHAASALSAAVAGAVRTDLFDPAAPNLDLYGGVGLLAAAVADRFPGTVITSVESDARATGHARENLRDLAGASADTGRVDAYLRRLAASSPDGRRATVVLDPPRSGAGRDVIDLLAAFDPAQLVYVACDPVALARDVALLADRGYGLAAVRAFDLFPHTHHVEAVATFVKQ